MKSKFTAVLGFALMLTPFSVFAAQNSQKVTFPATVTLNGTTVPAGTYKVEWDGTGSVTANIVKGKKVVASAPATVTESKSGYDGALDVQGKTLQGIEFKNASLQFTQGGGTPAGQ